MSNFPLGLGLGLAAAACQSISYLQSRHFVGSEDGGRWRLMLLAHIIQGLASLAILPVLWPADMPDWRRYAGPIVLESLGYLAGQICLFTALRHTEASRVSPFLGIKIAMVAVLAWALLGRAIVLQQWLAVGLAVLAAWLLTWTSGRTPGKAVAAVLLACIGYAISDLYIRVAIERMQPVPPLQAGLVACGLSYAFCGLAVLPLWWKVGTVTAADFRRASPYALTWLAGMGLLYGCFALVGIVLGNIVQSTRGLISILIAPVVARSGYDHLETVHPPHAIARQVGCGLLMFAAVVLYVIGAAT